MAYVKKIKIGDNVYDIADSRIITLTDNGSTTAGTWVASTAIPEGNITEYVDGQLFLYKVTVAGDSTTTLNIDGLGAKTIYRVGTTKLSTQYGVGQYLLLAYNSANDCFRVVNDSDANSYAYLRQYQHGANAAGTAGKYPLLARYNVTNKNGSYDTAYARYHTGAYVDTSTGELYSEGSKVLTEATPTAAAITAINPGSGSMTATTKYLHKSTTNAAPNAHTHSVTVSGTTGANSGDAITVVTGVASNGTATALTGVKASSTATFLKEINAGSGSLEAYNASTNGTVQVANGTRIPVVTSVTHTAASLGTASTGTVTISGGSYSGTTKYMKVSTTAADTGTVGISGGSGSLEAYDAATNGTKKVSNGTRIGYITSLSKGGYTPAGSVTLTAGTAPSMNFNTGTNTDTPYISALTNGSYTPAGSVSLTNGTAPSMGAATTKYLSASASGTAVGANGTGDCAPNNHTHTVTVSGTSGANSGTGVNAVNASVSGTILTLSAVTAAPNSHTHSYGSSTALTTSANNGTKVTALTGVKVTAQPTISLTANTSSATDRITYVESQGTFSAGTTPKSSASFSGTATTALVTGGTTKYMKFSAGTTPKSSASFTGTNSTAVVTGGTTYYLAHGHTAASLTGTKTFNTNGVKAVSLSASTTSTDGPAYTESISGSAPSLGGTKTFVTGYGSFSGGSITPTTYYLAHGHTGASAKSSASAITAVAADGTATVLTGVKASGTASVAPSGHTHSYGSSTALTTGNNSGSAVAAITSLTANTTAATGDITYVESASHTHTAPSVKTTANVYKPE